MRIGLQIPSFKYPGGTAAIRPKLKEIVTTAEEAGFYSLWVMDHYYQIKGLFGEAYTDPMLESYTTLGYFAGLTEKAYLGVLVTGVIYRHPAVLMKMVNTLDILSGGRAYLGIGAAWYEDEAKGYGIPYPSTAERFEQLEDNLELAKALWASDETSFAGKHFAAPAITNNPRPLSTPHPRIMIGGTGPKKTLRMVAQYADACNIGDWVGADNMQKALDDLKGHCATLGRDYATVEKTSLGTVHLSGDDTVDGVIAPIKALAAMGFTHAIFNMPDVYKVTPLEAFGKEIIPAIAGLQVEAAGSAMRMLKRIFRPDPTIIHPTETEVLTLQIVNMDIEFNGIIWFWKGPAPWYFVTVPAEQSADLKAISGFVTYGWGVIPVRVRIGNTEWTTSLFPKNDLYLVPIKASVRQAENLAECDEVAVRLDVG